MKQHGILVVSLLVFCTLVAALQVFAQVPDRGIRLGVAGGFLAGSTEKDDDAVSEAIRGYLRYTMSDCLLGDLAGTYGGIKATDYQADLWLAEYKILYRVSPSKDWDPYVGAGLGLAYYYAHPNFRAIAFDKDGYVGYVPIALGVEYVIAENFQLDLNASYNYSFSDDIVTNKLMNTNGGGANDAWWGVFLGLSATIFGGDNDADNDGLLKSVEKQIGTNPNKADTDGDGLKDGEELNTYRTDPLKIDGDADGLSDKDELLKYKTNPNRADTDGDGLSDGDEVTKYKTDPLKTDTDGDGLTDAVEVTKSMTNPLVVDTDGDGLSDADEVNKYKTDPLKADTDGDGLADGDEIAKKTNPLDPNDPPKKKEIVVMAEVGKAIVLEGIVFKSGSAVITPESEEILGAAKKAFEDNADIVAEIRGYTDNVGSAKNNLALSQKRADAVKAWLVKNGIAANRITAKGFGDKNPVADNATPEGRQQNRRIEFFRVK